MSLLPVLTVLGCTMTRHPTVQYARPDAAPTTPPASWAAVLAHPQPITVEPILVADMSVSTRGLINLDSPTAQAEGMTAQPWPTAIVTHLIRHPVYGSYLVDTGISADADGEAAVIPGLVARRTGLTLHQTTAEALAEHGAALSGVFITHSHLDHLLGLQDIPVDVPLYVGPGELSARAFGNRAQGMLLRDDLAGRPPIREWDLSGAVPLGGIDAALDVFGDGSLWALHVPGHTPGSMAYLVNAQAGPVLLTGDASHTRWGWEHGVEPGQFSQDIAAGAESFRRLQALVAENPRIAVAVGHELPPVPGAEPTPEEHHHGQGGSIHHRFDDAERWAAVFDDPARDAWQRPAELVAALGLLPGAVVADIGAGTGYMLPHLLGAVGPAGAVYGVDVEAAMVEHMRQRAAQAGWPNVHAVQAEPSDPHLPPGAVQLTLLVNTYHHIEDRPAYFAALRQAMAPGSRLVIVDYTPEAPMGPPPAMRLSAETVIAELAPAGWKLQATPAILPSQYVLIFGQ